MSPATVALDNEKTAPSLRFRLLQNRRPARAALKPMDGNGSGEVRVQQKPVLDGARDTWPRPPSMRPAGGMSHPCPHPRVTRRCRRRSGGGTWAAEKKPSQRRSERSRKEAGRERDTRSRSSSVTPEGRRLKSAKRGQPLRRMWRVLGKRRVTRAEEAARRLRTATEARVADSARCQERQTREAA
ncbi:hypothetical protein E2562_003343 [Oryza meyeriana var. granulata]|uniref:Uncharacterized protein n=1 Tax=Oryza meyeriana var. granulata TaxID=110450 RepID=A0A6G1EFD7_9ORYZ|nr:hypothetical protein E2562_003343 [Oryza meyeriana var. granulata]